MNHKLRKLIPFVFLAVISFAVVLPSVLLIAPQIVHAAPGDPAPAPATPAAGTTTNNPTAATSSAAAQKPTTGASGVDLGWIGNAVVQAMGLLVQLIVSILGLLTVALIHILILVAGYNNYMDAPVITTGWVIVRDIANLFFVALILIVSIGSIVNPERFGGVKQVFRILLFALLVNFSRTIAGIFIDISQLIMLTFVNGFAQAAGGNFVEALGVVKMTSVSSGSTAISFAQSLGGFILAVLFMVIVTVIIAIMVVALVVRMVTLWMLVVLSPLAFALGSSDMTKQHYAEWWKKFAAELTTGPIVAFFLWLALVSLQAKSGSSITGTTLKDASSNGEQTSVDCGTTDACTQENLIRFVVASVMLLMGLSFAKEFSGIGGSMAGAALSRGKNMANGALKWTQQKTTSGAKKVGGVALGLTPIPLAARKTGDLWNRGKAAAGRGLAGVSNSNSAVVRTLFGGAARNASIALSTSAGKRDAEKDKAARERLQYASPEALASVITSFSTSDAEKRAASMKVVKDKEYVGSRRDAADPREAQRARIFDQAAEHLRDIRPGTDKDLDDVVTSAKEKRPDAFWDPHDPRGRDQDAQIRATGNGLGRDDFFKLNINGMTDHDLQTLVEGIRPEVMTAILGRTTGRQTDRLHQLVLPAGAPPARVDTAIAEGVDWSRVRVNNAVVPPAAGARPAPPTVNGNIAERVTQAGTSVQVNQLTHNPEIDRVRTDVRDRFNAAVDPAAGRGINPVTRRIDDGNLRLAEANIMLNPGSMNTLRDTFRVTNDGNFATGEMRRSWEHSVRTAPQKVNLVMSLPAGVWNQNNDLTRDTVDNLTPADLEGMSREATANADLVPRFQAILRAIDGIATPTTPGAPLTSRQAIADGLRRYSIGHPDIVTFRT